MVNARDSGWVELVDNPVHRRSSLVHLPQAGAVAIGAVAAREHAMLRGVGGDHTEADVDATLRVLRSLQAALDDVLHEGGDRVAPEENA